MPSPAITGSVHACPDQPNLPASQVACATLSRYRSQSTGSPWARALAQQRDVAQRRNPVGRFSHRAIGNDRHVIAADVLRHQAGRPVSAARHAFGGVQSQQIPPGDAIHHAPDLGGRVWADIGRCRLALGPALKIESQAVPNDPSRAPFDRPHPAAFAKRAVVHVRPIGEVPHMIRRTSVQPQAMRAIMHPGQQPGLCRQASPAAPHVAQRIVDRQSPKDARSSHATPRPVRSR